MTERKAHVLDAMQEAYSDTVEILDRLVSRFVGCYGGDYEDLRSEADLAFMKAWDTHDYSIRSFEAWLKLKVWRSLQENMRVRLARHNRLPRVHLDLDARAAEVSPAPFNLGEFLEQHADLDADAKLVVGLVVNPPIPVRLATRERGEESVVNIRAAVKEYLRDDGWSKARIDASFTAVMETL